MDDIWKELNDCKNCKEVVDVLSVLSDWKEEHGDSNFRLNVEYIKNNNLFPKYDIDYWFWYSSSNETEGCCVQRIFDEVNLAYTSDSIENCYRNLISLMEMKEIK